MQAPETLPSPSSTIQEKRISRPAAAWPWPDLAGPGPRGAKAAFKFNVSTACAHDARVHTAPMPHEVGSRAYTGAAHSTPRTETRQEEHKRATKYSEADQQAPWPTAMLTIPHENLRSDESAVPAARLWGERHSSVSQRPSKDHAAKRTTAAGAWLMPGTVSGSRRQSDGGGGGGGSAQWRAPRRARAASRWPGCSRACRRGSQTWNRAGTPCAYCGQSARLLEHARGTHRMCVATSSRCWGVECVRMYCTR